MRDLQIQKGVKGVEENEGKKMEKKGNEKLQMSKCLSNGRALAFGAQWTE